MLQISNFYETFYLRTNIIKLKLMIKTLTGDLQTLAMKEEKNSEVTLLILSHFMVRKGNALAYLTFMFVM